MDNLHVPPETELLERARTFDHQALIGIYDYYSPRVYRYALRLIGDPERAEDCVAETFTRFLQALKSRKGPTDYIQAYLFRVAHNWITDQYYRQIQIESLFDEFPDRSAGAEETTDLHIRQMRLRSALQKLTPDQRQVIALKYLEEWDNELIARALKKPVGAVKSLQHRALANLKRLISIEDI
jgi:RNA polymerase sigma-70 factor, ECF subfamily